MIVEGLRRLNLSRSLCQLNDKRLGRVATRHLCEASYRCRIDFDGHLRISGGLFHRYVP